MDLLDNVATELGFEFHLYVVRDQLFGSKQRNFKDFIPHKQQTDKKVSNSEHDSGYKSSNTDQQHRQHSNSGGGDSNTNRKYLLLLKHLKLKFIFS